MQIGAADAARLDRNQDLAGSGLWNRPRPQHQRGIRSVHNHGAHHCHSECLKLDADIDPRFQLVHKAFTSTQ